MSLLERFVKELKSYELWRSSAFNDLKTITNNATHYRFLYLHEKTCRLRTIVGRLARREAKRVRPRPLTFEEYLQMGYTDKQARNMVMPQ